MRDHLRSAETQIEHWERPEPNSAHAADYLRHLQANDQVAWEKFLAEWTPRLYNYISYNLRADDEVEDILSETLLAVVQAINNFDGHAALSTFVYSIVRRKIADYWRGRHVTTELPEWLSMDDASEARIAFYEVLSTLSEMSQQALLLRYQVGLSVTEVAEVLERSYKATESLLSRAREQFQIAFLESAKT